MRRDFIANAAHELRTPLTNLQGYLEALRDGVIAADRATYESLCEEAERLVRLSRSLDALAEGDAGDDAARARRARPRGGDPDRRSTSPSRRSSGPACGSSVDVPGAPAGAGQPRPARPGPRQPALERRSLHAGRRHGHGPRRTPAGGPPGLDREHRRRDPAGRPRPRLRAVLSGREVARPGARRRRDRARHRQAARRGGRRPGRRRVGRRPDPLLVQPAGLRPPSLRADAIATIPTRIPPSPSHWIGSSRSPRNATATMIVTAGPNDAASPTSQVGARLEPDTRRRRGRAHRARRPGSRHDDDPASALPEPPSPSSPSMIGAARPRTTVSATTSTSVDSTAFAVRERVDLEPGQRLEDDVA